MQLPYPLRLAGQRLLGAVPVRIRSGVNRGRRWSLACLGRGYGSGRFGRDRLEALAALTRPGDSLWDVGAHKGFVTLAASGMVGSSGEVVAIEPAEVNLDFLRRHMEWNALENVRVVPAALGAEPGTSTIGGAGSSVAFRVGVGPQSVRVETVESLVERIGCSPPSVMKIDVEGAEADVLRGTGRWLGGELALLISTHGRECYEECRELLLARGFRLWESWEIADRLRDGRPWTSDHDLLALGPGRRVADGTIERLRLIAGPRSAHGRKK